MRNLLALLGAGTLTFVGLGWYLDWYKIERKASPVAGTQRLEFDINGQKIGGDAVTALKRGGELIEKLNESNAGSTPKAEEKPQEDAKPAATTTGGWFSGKQ